MGLTTLPAHASRRDQAREALKNGDYALAIEQYNAVSKDSGDAALVAEYAWALALEGYTEMALSQLDRAFLLDARSDAVRYFGAAILAPLGLGAAAREIARPAPKWIAGDPSTLKRLEFLNPLGSFNAELAAANVLMAQKRYVWASARFYRITSQYPKERLGWTGYAIALENLGAVKSAAQAVSRDLALRENTIDNTTRELLVAHKKELEQRPPLSSRQSKLVQMIKGRYLAFTGGNVTQVGSDTLVNLNGRVGKFLTSRFDVAANAGVALGNSKSDYNGLTLGGSGRFNVPLPLNFPLNATAAAKIGVAPSPSDRFFFILSPGLSHFMASGSIDLFLDIALSGPFKDTKTISIGYTIYFGGSR